MDGRVLSEDELQDAYDHARDFLADDNLTSIERALCLSVIGMYNAIRDRDETISALRLALEIANDCLFGNTHGDWALKEAYQTIHASLAKLEETSE